MFPWRAMSDLAAVLASRVGGVLVNLIVLPVFLRHLAPADFGIVAVILSLQSFLLFMDLGMSTLIGRDVAASAGDAVTRARTWVTFNDAERLIAIVYGILLVGSIVVASALSTVAPWIAGGAVVLFGLVVAQNLSAAVLLNASHFRTVSVLQSAGPLVRGVVTALALVVSGAGLRAFLVAQIVTSLLYYLLTRRLARDVFAATLPDLVDVPAPPLLALVRRAKPLLLLGLFGAAATQLDKVAIGAFASVSAVGPYFLASTFALVPIAVLSGPVTQVHLPRVIASYETSDPNGGHVAERFASVLLVVVLPATLCLWVYGREWCEVWLRDPVTARATAAYAAVLLPGSFIGALGFLPYSLLVARQDFSFLGRLQTVLAVVYLTGIAVLLSGGSGLVTVAWLYVGYSSASTVTQWVRALRGPRDGPLALRMLKGLSWALAVLLVVFGPLAILTRWIAPPWLGMLIFTAVAGLASVAGVVRALTAERPALGAVRATVS